MKIEEAVKCGDAFLRFFIPPGAEEFPFVAPD